LNTRPEAELRNRRQERQENALSRGESASRAAVTERTKSPGTPPIKRTQEERRELRANLRRWWNLGFEILPVKPGDKAPPIGGYSSRKTFKSLEDMMDFFEANPEANFAVATGPKSGLFVLDLDGREGLRSYLWLTKKQGYFPRTPRVDTPRGGSHFWFDCRNSAIRNSVSTIASSIDVRGDGGYALLPGSIGADGTRYRFRRGRSSDDCDIARAPPWLIALAAKPRSKPTSRSIIPIERKNRPPAIPPRYGAAALASESARVRSLPEGRRNDGLNRSAHRLGQLVGAGALDEASARTELAKAGRATGLPDREVASAVESGISAGKQTPRLIEARRSDGAAENLAAQPDPLAEELAKLGSRDIDNAQRLRARDDGKLMFTAGGGWFVYSGKHWKRDEVGEILACATDVARRIENETEFKTGNLERQAFLRHARRSGSRSAIDAMVHLARPLFRIGDDELDRDKDLLNVENGTLNLRTGELRPHDPQDRITKLVPIAYDPDAECPMFSDFLDDITEGDEEFRRFLRRVFGYCLTGRTDEQVFFFIIGPKGTGKSVLGNVLRELLGEYGLQADMETFLIKQYGNGIPSDVARLRGARVVVSSEANVNRQIDEARIKTMTGGDPLVARFMRQNEFQFTPEFKLALIANNFPRVRRKDDAFWRRARVIPVNRVVPGSKVDPGLQEKLRRELPGILAWAVRGCLSWQRNGLPLPPVVLEATERWKTFADVVGRFIVERCELDPDAKVRSSILFEAYTAWCLKNDETPQTQSGFRTSLLSHDLTSGHTRDGNIWRGIRLRS
jgi:putative DNA primase/helicase